MASFVNGPNALSLSRIPLAWLFSRVLTKSPGAALVVLAAAAASDLADGWLARRPGHDKHPSGAWLDPVCDKIFTVSALNSLIRSRGFTRSEIAPAFARELVQLFATPLYLARFAKKGPSERSRITVSATPLGKVTTVVQFLAAAAIARRGKIPKSLVWAAGGLGFLAAAHYHFRFAEEAATRESLKT